MAEQEIEFSIEDRSRYVRALYAFEANDSTQLTINPGDILEVFYRDDSGWWDGKNIETQNDGYFPGNYTEPLGDNLDIIKQQLLFIDQQQQEQQQEHQEEEQQQEIHSSRSSVISLMKESPDTSIDIRNAEPIFKRCSKCIKNDCNLCTIHCRAFCIYIPFCTICDISQNNDKLLDFEYDAYIFRVLSTIQHGLCIFGSVSLNHFISSLIYDFYNNENNINWISSNNQYGKTVFIRFIITISLTIIYIIFLFLTSNTALQFLKQSPENKQTTNKRDRNIQRMNYCLFKFCRNISLKCGQCGIKSCRHKPYSFIYTQFIMLLCSYILAFLWQDLCLDFQTNYLLNHQIKTDWYKNILFLFILLIISFICIFLLKRKLNSVYHIYRYYNKQARDNFNKLQLKTKKRRKKHSNHHQQQLSPLPKSLHSINNNINEPDPFQLEQDKEEEDYQQESNDDDDVSRPYQVSLYLYFWCLLTEITLFMLALPIGSCFASFCYWLLSATKIWNARATRIITMIIYVIAFLIIYLLSWRVIHIAMHFKNNGKYKKKNKNKNKNNIQINGGGGTTRQLIVGGVNRLRGDSVSKSITITNTQTSNNALSTPNESLLLNHETQSNLTIYSVNTTMDQSTAESFLGTTTTTTINSNIISNDEDEMIAEYESDIPDFIVMILMKYYGLEIETTEFKILSVMLIGIFFCDIFIIGCWFNLWMLFDNDSDPFNNIENDDSTHSNYDKYLDPNTEYLIYNCLLTLLLPFICSYLFGKTFKYFCCRKNNYKLSIALEKDKLWMKSLLSRWFIVIQALILGYLWCEYFQVLWFKHIDTKWYTLSTGLAVIIIYLIIFITIGVFKLNKKLLRLLWTMHDEDDDIFNNDKTSNIIKRKGYTSLQNHHNNKHRRQSGVGNLGLNASVNRQFQIEKKLGRRMISHNTQKAKQATHKLVVINTPTNTSSNNDDDDDDDDDDDKEDNNYKPQQLEITNNVLSDSSNNNNNSNINNNNNKQKRKINNKMSGLSTSLLQSDDEDDAQIL